MWLYSNDLRSKEAMQAVPATVGAYTGMFDLNNMVADPTVVIDCDDSNLQLWSGNQQVYDSRFNTVYPSLQGQRACTVPGTRAYSIPTFSSTGPRYVIILCYSNFADTLQSWNTDEPRIRIGSNYRYSNWYGVSFNYFDWYTSNTILHEFMHCITLQNGPISGVNTISYNLPQNTGLEVYEYTQIKALPDEVKAYNANGYSMLGTALWLYYNKISAGTIQWPWAFMAAQYPGNRRPGQGPHQ